MLKLAKRDCETATRAYDLMRHELGCGHLPALPGEIDQVNDSSTVTEIHRVAMRLADTLKAWKPKTPHICACANPYLTTRLSGIFEALAETLSATSDPCADQPNKTQHYYTIRRSLHERIGTVETMTCDLADRTALARPIVETALTTVKSIFDRAVKADCVHIPAAVMNATAPAATVAAIDRLYRLAQRTRGNLEDSVYPPCCYDDELVNLPESCCATLPAQTCAELVRLAHTWEHVYDVVRLYVHGHGTKEAMAEAARDLEANAALLT